MLRLEEGAVIVFVSDSHIGGDPGCDGFESPVELMRLFDELSASDGRVELVLAGDFFDFLQIGEVPEGTNRALLTISRPEYVDLFAALRRFRSGEGKRVIYLPGNHDAESFWNNGVQQTLHEHGLVDEFAYRYVASLHAGGTTHLVYCEHGNQLDAANTVGDYHDPLDTPLGHHVVTDFTRRIAPLGEVSRGLDLAEIKAVYPLVAIPRWVASRYFYDFAGKIVAYLLLPLFVTYLIYRLAILSLEIQARGISITLTGGPRELPALHRFFVDVGFYGLIVVAISVVFFLLIRHAVRKTMSTVSPDGKARYSPAEASENRVRAILRGEQPVPMDPSLDPTTIDVFVSGHTHLPAMARLERPGGREAVLVNSGCWLRQLHPVTPRLKGPPVFVSEFVLTYVRVFVAGSRLRVELWEQPKPAWQSLTRIERLLSWRRRPEQPAPDAPPRIRAQAEL